MNVQPNYSNCSYTELRKLVRSEKDSEKAKVIAKVLVERIWAQEDKTKIPKTITKAFYGRLVVLAEIKPENQLPFEGRKKAPGRITIDSDILSSLRGEGLPQIDVLRQIHMTDRLGLLFLMMVAVRNTPYQYLVAKTELQFGTGSKENNTNASHSGPLPQFARQREGRLQKRFIADMFLYLSMNRTHELPRSDNEVDMKLEPRMRAVVIKAMNQVASGTELTIAFESVVGKIQSIVKETKEEWKALEGFEEKLKGIKAQKKGIYAVIDKKTGKVDPEFYRMNGFIVDGPELKKILKEHSWTTLSSEMKTRLFDAMQAQINAHSAVPFLQKRSPTLLARLADQ